MKTIYLLLTRSGTSVARIIHALTADPYTHISISFHESLEPTYSAARKNGETLFPAGPCEENFFRGYWRRHPLIPCALYALQVSDDVYYKAKEEANKIMERSDDCSFNIIGLIFCRIHLPVNRRWHYFCSQFVGEVLERSHAMTLPKAPPLMRPSDYADLPELTCLFRGTLGDLMRRTATVASF